MYCLLFLCLFLLIGGHFSELSFSGFHTPKRRARHHSPFRSAPSEKREIPPQNDRTATNPTQNPSKNVPVLFEINSNAIRALQPTPSGSLVSIIPDLNSVNACVHIHHDTVENTIFVLNPGCPRVKSTGTNLNQLNDWLRQWSNRQARIWISWMSDWDNGLLSI